MIKNDILDKKSLFSFIIFTALVLALLSGCATPPPGEMRAEEVKAPSVEGLSVTGSHGETLIEVINSEPVPYTLFKLAGPPRVILDIRGEPGPELPALTEVNDGNIGDISFEEGRTQAMTTRMTVTLMRKIDYTVTKAGNKIRITITPRQVHMEPSKPVETEVSEGSGGVEDLQEMGPVQAEPRILFKPRETDLNQVLGIDFTMLDMGKSRLIVTTDKKVPYDLERKGAKGLLLRLKDATIPSLLLREIDTTHFQSALTRVRPSISVEKKEVSIAISLREPVPFHVKQSDKTIHMDFDQTPVKVPDKKIIPLEIADSRTDVVMGKHASPMDEMAAEELGVTEGGGEGFKGEPMYLDFVNADVTHILRLINEISSENIIWDPAITGRKVSLILKNVPWDEALELILKNNDLAKRYVGKNIVWITTKAKMKQILAEEEAEDQKLQKKLEDERKKIEEQTKKAKEEEPLITEYLPVDFATASEIQDHITPSARGSMSIDTRTNTIIIKDTAESIEEAKKTVKQFDTPVKQIMIEARIVDASDDLTRDLGIVWGSNTSAYRSDNSIAGATVPAVATTNLTSGGDQIYGGSFSTNAPSGWTGSGGLFGLNFATLTSSGMGAITLDARLALSESEGKSKTISAPKVIAREGTTASIHSGEELIIAATENVASTTLPADLSLEVTPTTVSFNNYITMDVKVTDDQVPSTSKKITKSISVNLMIKSGDTVVIGGILKESESDSVSGVPWIKDIPGLGWLFKAKGRVKRKSELLIFLTPTVLPSPAKDF